MLSFQHLDIQLIFRTSPMVLLPTFVLPGNIKLHGCDRNDIADDRNDFVACSLLKMISASH